MSSGRVGSVTPCVVPSEQFRSNLMIRLGKYANAIMGINHVPRTSLHTPVSRVTTVRLASRGGLRIPTVFAHLYTL